MRIVLAGGLDSALTHFAMIGLAGILQEAGASRVRLQWKDSAKAEPTVSWDGPDAAEAVLAHAQRHANQDSWVQAKTSFTTSKGEKILGLFSPRLTLPQEDSQVQQFEDHREEFLNSDLTTLDHLMISNLGEPGYWIFDRNKRYPDNSASRWEMKTRNRGEEFVGNRLSKLASTVSSLDKDSIDAGLTGRNISDPLGKDRPDSRTSTGLTPPGPVDDALAWCGLWGISGFILVPGTGSDISATAGAVPQQRLHPRSLVIPITEKPMSPAAWRALMATRAIIDITSSDESSMATASDYLKARGVLGICTFPVYTTNNSNAPERMVLSGAFHSLNRVPDDLH